MHSISVPRLLIFLALIVFAPNWKTTQYVAGLVIPTAHAQTVAPTCPEGYTLSGNTCVKNAPAPSCPSGYVFSQGQCVVSASNGPWAFVVTLALGVKSATELDGATVCVVPGSASQAAATNYFQTNRLKVSFVSGNTLDAVKRAYDRAACDVLVVEANAANTTINGLSRPNDHGILPERIVKSVASSPPVQRAPPSTAAPGTPRCPAGYGFSNGNCRKLAAPTQRPVDLARPLQVELKRIGCYTGGIDGDWGRGSQAALKRFSNRTGLGLGILPTQNALNEARRRSPGFCPVQVAPKRTKPQGCRSGTVFLEGQCIPNSQVQSFCGPGFKRSGSKCVQMGDASGCLKKCKSRLTTCQRNIDQEEGEVICLNKFDSCNQSC